MRDSSLYRVMRSGCADFDDAIDGALVFRVIVGGSCIGWKERGGYYIAYVSAPHRSTISRAPIPIRPSGRRKIGGEEKTHPFHPAPAEHPLRSRLHAPPIPLQIPLDIPSAELREHGGYLLDLRWVGGVVAVSVSGRRVGGGGRRGGGGGGGEEEVVD